MMLYCDTHDNQLLEVSMYLMVAEFNVINYIIRYNYKLTFHVIITVMRLNDSSSVSVKFRSITDSGTMTNTRI